MSTPAENDPSESPSGEILTKTLARLTTRFLTVVAIIVIALVAWRLGLFK